ncbi:MAG: L,D-transpeptidase [Methylobacteriaceae bacterium]|nr:L,D-transpeptidase [Methylobacteriaceae bacterium]
MSQARCGTVRRRSKSFDGLILATLIVAVLLVGGAMSSARARETVSFDNYPPGIIVIRSGERRLYFTLGQGTAIRYPVAVGKHGHAWAGLAHIEGKFVRPAWSPPPEVKRDIPSLPDVIPGGSPHNPMGERALTLDRDEIAIHGTNARMRASVGTAASYGCIRMYNEDVIDLYDRVQVGTPVLVLP